MLADLTWRDFVRKAERISLDEPARLHPNSWSSIEARLLDCSAEGFRAACEARVRVGSSVRIELPGLGPVEATVSWCRGQEFGACFLQPIDLDKADLRPMTDEMVLSRLLIQRAAAHMSGREGPEQQLRRRIRDALPMRRPQGEGPAAEH